MRIFPPFLAWFVLFCCIATAARGEEGARVKTGEKVKSLIGIDEAVDRFMDQWDLPGGAVAITKDGRLVYARGFGWADVAKQEPVEPDDLFRIASISKPITSAMILKLAEQGKLRLDDPVLSHLGDLKPLPEDAPIDPRFKQVTIRHCLMHTGGFDRGVSFDPMFMPKPMMELTASPVDTTTIIRFMLGRPLDFTPGEKHAYSNFGYCMLGRIIERITGKTYEEAVREVVLKPLGAERTKMGKTQLAGRADDEVCYYAPEGTKTCKSIFPDVAEEVTRPYGGFYIEAMDAHGGWISSTTDLLRLVTSLEGTREPRILSEDSVRRMIQDSIFRDSKSYSHYGLGWSVGLTDGHGPHWKESNWSHNGSLDGTATMVVRSHRGIAWAVLFNRRPNGGEFYGAMDRAFWDAVDAVQEWPEHNLFDETRE
ncbi:MAG TPA: hypothetical protein DD670_14905 [Planctomycetaceae bacterium]|nr:hypothetical protein [Planctomycetaceae bacterium]